jgi:hypothetical protein
MTIEELQEKVDIVLSIIRQTPKNKFIATIGGKNILYIMFDETIKEKSTVDFIRSYGFNRAWHGMYIEADCLPSEFEVYSREFPNPDFIRVEKSSIEGKVLPPLNMYSYIGGIHYNDVSASYNLYYKDEYHKGVMTKDKDGWYQAFGLSILGEYVKWLIEKKNIF